MLLVVILTVFLDLVGYGIVIPLMPFYVKKMNGSGVIVGVLLSSFAIAQLLATPILGRLSDKYGRRRVILLSLIGNAASMVVFAFAANLAILPLLFLSRMLAGATAGNLAACQAAIADVTDRESRAASMGRLGAGISLGLIFGPVFGGWLNELGSWVPPVGAAAMALLDVVLTFFLMPETLRARRSSRSLPPVGSFGAAPIAPTPAAPAPLGPESTAVTRPGTPSIWAVLSERRMAAVLVLYFLTFLCMSNIQVALALLTQERLQWGPAEVGYSFGLFGTIGLIVQGALIGRLVRALGELSLIIIGALLNGAGMLLIGFGHTSAPVIGGLVLVGSGIALTNPSLSSLASRLARDEQQGAVLGFAQSAGGLARTVGPPWSGFLYEHLGPASPFIGGAITAAFSFLVGLSVRADGLKRREGTGPSTPNAPGGGAEGSA